VLNMSTIFPPKDCVVPLRSGAIAPLNTYTVDLCAIPLWNRLPVVGSISYQRVSAPRPPVDAFTVCWVQKATLPPWFGSGANHPFISRASSVSSVNDVPAWGALGG